MRIRIKHTQSKRFFSFITVIFVLVWLVEPSFIYHSNQAKAETVSWWDTAYGYRNQLTITNNSDSALPSGYSVSLSLDHFSLVEQGKSLADGNDIRIVYWNGSTNTELDRVNEGVWNMRGINSQIWFKTQAEIVDFGTDNNYYLYYGYANAGTPLANQSNVYQFYDDFSGHSVGALNNANWTVQSGTWNIETDTQADGSAGNVLSYTGTGGGYNYAYINDTVGDFDNVVVEVKTKMVSAQYFPFGARLNDSTGANYCAFNYNTNTKILRFSAWTSIAGTVDTSNARGGLNADWHTLQFRLDGSVLSVTYDGSTFGSSGTDTNLATGNVYVMGYGTNHLHFDDLIVRKYLTNEPTVSADSEEISIMRPVVTLEKKWRLKADGYTQADQKIKLLVDFPEAPYDAAATYSIVGQSMTGTMIKTSDTTWQKEIDITNLPVGTHIISATVSAGGFSYSGDRPVFYVSYPFYHIWSFDWEGGCISKSAYLDPLNNKANEIGMPLVHMYNPRIYIPGVCLSSQVVAMDDWVKMRRDNFGDEIGLHLHMYQDFVASTGVNYIDSPHCYSRPDGYDVPTYSYSDNSEDDFAVMLSYAKNQFSNHGLLNPVSFRAGGGAARLSTYQALQDSGFKVETSSGFAQNFGSCEVGWDANFTASPYRQPYHPCNNDVNGDSCTGEGTNMSIWGMPINLGNSADGSSPNIKRFNTVYGQPPFNSIKVGVFLSHYGSYPSDPNNAERQSIDIYFNHLNDYLYANDSGAVKYATFQNVLEAFNYSPPKNPAFLGPSDLVTGKTITNKKPAFNFELSGASDQNSMKYRIVIDDSVDFSSPTVDYISGLSSQKNRFFTVGQQAGQGEYLSGFLGQNLPNSPYYWRVMAIDSQEGTSAWTTASNNGPAFSIYIPPKNFPLPRFISY